VTDEQDKPLEPAPAEQAGSEAAVTGRFPIGGAVIVALVLSGLVAGAAEGAVRIRGDGARWPTYAGGLAAGIAALSGLPFLLKIARSSANDGGFWKNWGLGLLTRTLVGLLGAGALLQWLSEQADVGVIVLALVYFVALMIETVWVAKRISAG